MDAQCTINPAHPSVNKLHNEIRKLMLIKINGDYSDFSVYPCICVYVCASYRQLYHMCNFMSLLSQLRHRTQGSLELILYNPPIPNGNHP